MSPDEFREKLRGTVLAVVIAGVLFTPVLVHDLGEAKAGERLSAYATLIGAGMAIVAAFVGGYFINRQTVTAKELEEDRRRRKRAAARAGLALVIYQCSEYLRASIETQHRKYRALKGEQGLGNSVPPVLPEAVISKLLEFIELEDGAPAETATLLLRSIQILHARTMDPGLALRVLRDINHLGYMADAVMIACIALSLYDYARGRLQSVDEISETSVRSATMEMFSGRMEPHEIHRLLRERLADLNAGRWPIHPRQEAAPDATAP